MDSKIQQRISVQRPHRVTHYKLARLVLLGVMTFVTLFPVLPLLHFTGIEPFRFPPSLHAWLAIFGIAGTGVIFNAGFMVRSSYPIKYSLLTFVHGVRSFLVYGDP